jgi:hypothetical protein
VHSAYNTHGLNISGAEAANTLCAIEFSRDLELQSIILKSDSLQIVDTLKENKSN